MTPEQKIFATELSVHIDMATRMVDAVFDFLESKIYSKELVDVPLMPSDGSQRIRDALGVAIRELRFIRQTLNESDSQDGFFWWDESAEAIGVAITRGLHDPKLGPSTKKRINYVLNKYSIIPKE